MIDVIVDRRNIKQGCAGRSRKMQGGKISHKL
jgi:hypothetical protein